MKKKNIILFLLMALPTLLLTSCLKDQEDLFTESASQRTTTYLAKAKKVLTSSENGWGYTFHHEVHGRKGYRGLCRADRRSHLYRGVHLYP